MGFMKRIMLFMLVNILVVATVSILLYIFGVGNYIGAGGLDYGNLAAFCLIWGFAGSFISLGLSRIMAKWTMKVRVLDPSNAHGPERELVNMVHSLSQRAGLPKMPEVGIYDSPEVNAFATGPTKSRSLVAVSSGLLSSMNRQQVEGVIAHEVAHIANGDMVTLTLVQGVVNAFVMFIARVLSFAITQALRKDDDESPAAMNFFITFALQIVLGFFGMMVVSWFSRLREFRADAGGAQLAGRASMIAALEALQRRVDFADAEGSTSMQAFKISSKRGGFLSLLSTHPPLEDRIAALKNSHVA